MRTLIEVSPGETRAATVDQRLVEFQIVRIDRPSLIGGIYRGRVTRVEAGLGGAFVAIGAAREGFLRHGKGLHEGQAITVQVIRDADGTKGPALNARVVLTGRYVGWTPGRPGIVYSPRLGSGRRRAELEALAPGLVSDAEGISIRAAAARVEDDVVVAEISRLRGEWAALESAAKDAASPATLIEPLSLIARILRDGNDDAVVIDDRASHRDAQTMIAATMPDRVLHRHDAKEPIFDAYGIADEVATVSSRIVSVPRGARLTFDATEALMAIDVDSAAGGRGIAEDAILRTNIDALAEVARQVRLRNLSGLIVIDFISMRRRASNTRLLQAAKKAFRRDPQQVDVLGISAAGLLEVTRRRHAPPLDSYLLERGPAQPTPESAACDILREALRSAGGTMPQVDAAPDIIAALQGPFGDALAQVNRRLGQELTLHPVPGKVGWKMTMQRGRRA
jgi:Rne/Rng family ribonuclease